MYTRSINALSSDIDYACMFIMSRRRRRELNGTLDDVRGTPVSVKHGAPLSETSPMLHDICRLKSWESVLIKLMQLYESEVLGKWPVMQHFCFGKYISLSVEEEESG